MTTYHYILDGTTPVIEPDLRRWRRWFEATQATLIRTTIPGGGVVSTMFTGLDLQWGAGPPLLFQTLVFGGPWDGEIGRYATWDEAQDGHQTMVKKVCGPHTP